jgi:hypothetical protein
MLETLNNVLSQCKKTYARTMYPEYIHVFYISSTLNTQHTYQLDDLR